MSSNFQLGRSVLEIDVGNGWETFDGRIPAQP